MSIDARPRRPAPRLRLLHRRGVHRQVTSSAMSPVVIGAVPRPAERHAVRACNRSRIWRASEPDDRQSQHDRARLRDGCAARIALARLGLGLRRRSFAHHCRFASTWRGDAPAQADTRCARRLVTRKRARCLLRLCRGRLFGLRVATTFSPSSSGSRDERTADQRVRLLTRWCGAAAPAVPSAGAALRGAPPR